MDIKSRNNSSSHFIKCFYWQSIDLCIVCSYIIHEYTFSKYFSDQEHSYSFTSLEKWFYKNQRKTWNLN